MLMLDRYLVARGRALDLATGAPIRWHVRRNSARASAPVFSERGRWWLIDVDVRGQSRVEVWERPSLGPLENGQPSGLDALRAALGDARDGRPRAIDLEQHCGRAWARSIRVLAREARLGGFVPIAVEALGAVLAQSNWRWPGWLKDRSLVLFTSGEALSSEATIALFRLATRDARPHVIVRAALGELLAPARLVTAPTSVHESAAPLLDGSEEPANREAADTIDNAELLAPRADRLLASGRVADAEACARWGILLSPSGSAQIDAHCALARCLIRQHRTLEARAAIAQIPSEKAEEIRRDLARSESMPHASASAEPGMAESFLQILRICQEIEDESLALTRVAALVREKLSATIAAFVVKDHQLRVLSHAGARVPAIADLELASRVVDTGVATPAHGGRPAEAAWPVRYGSTVVGVLWCHWAVEAPLLGSDIATLMGIAATAAAPALHGAVERSRVRRVDAEAIPDLIGESEGIEQVRQAVLRAAASPFPVLIEGESGSGKELVARAVHLSSPRRAKRFCALNCAALAEDLVEAELFGHTRGAFTGAIAERSGLFEEAQGGTLFLDEVAELSPRVQAKLLRVLQEGEVRRLGESTTRRVDTRIVAATNRPLAREVEHGRFRGDLRYRLDVIRIAIPPLRERLEDLPALVRHIWTTLAARSGSRSVLSPSAVRALSAYEWPGNVRELQNVLASLMVAGPQRGVIGHQSLPAHLARAGEIQRGATLAEARRAFESRFVRAAMLRAGGRTTTAARELGVSRQGLSKLLARLDLSTDAYQPAGEGVAAERRIIAKLE
jgi:two-component system response regulator AtoC